MSINNQTTHHGMSAHDYYYTNKDEYIRGLHKINLISKIIEYKKCNFNDAVKLLLNTKTYQKLNTNELDNYTSEEIFELWKYEFETWNNELEKEHAQVKKKALQFLMTITKR